MLEFTVNAFMLVEVLVRYLALDKRFWESTWNVVDLVLVAVCLLTMLFIFYADCSKTKTREALFDLSVLFLRNLLQFFRLANILKEYHITTYLTFIYILSTENNDSDQTKTFT
jgi:hypothetical protein